MPTQEIAGSRKGCGLAAFRAPSRCDDYRIRKGCVAFVAAWTGLAEPDRWSLCSPHGNHFVHFSARRWATTRAPRACHLVLERTRDGMPNILDRRQVMLAAANVEGTRLRL